MAYEYLNLQKGSSALTDFREVVRLEKLRPEDMAPTDVANAVLAEYGAGAGAGGAGAGRGGRDDTWYWCWWCFRWC